MKRLIYTLFTLLLMLLVPTFVSAASISLEGSNNENITIYKIKYNPESNTVENIKLKIQTTNDDLDYSLKETGYVTGKCEKLECTLDVSLITTEVDIAELVVTNNSTEKKGTTITVKSTPSSGTIDDVEKTFTVNEVITTKKAESSDATLSSLKVNVGTFDKAFNKNVYDYTITGIKDTINSVTFSHECDNCNVTVTCPNGICKVLSNQKVQLETGANQVSINVVSQDKSNDKTYNFTIYRGEIEKPSAYLSDLSIEDAIISPKFDVLNNDYTVTVSKEVKDLKISAIPEDPKAKVEIKGDTDLKDGENTVTITVTSSDNESKQVYTILVTREEKEEKTTKKLVTTKVKKTNNKNKYLIIIAAIIALAIIIVSFILIFKKKNKNKDKNNKSNNNNGNEERNLETKKSNDLDNTKESIERINTDQLNILEATRRELNNEPKQNVDEALDDLMKTKKLELGDLEDYY